MAELEIYIKKDGMMDRVAGINDSEENGSTGLVVSVREYSCDDSRELFFKKELTREDLALIEKAIQKLM